MKTVVHTKRSKDKALHIETEGCIVNIRVGLTSDAGQEVTNINVRTDQYAGEPQWYLVDEQGNRMEHLGFRVVRETDKEFENRRAYERMINKREAKLTLQDALRLNKYNPTSLLTFKDRTDKDYVYTVEIVKTFSTKDKPSVYRVYTTSDRFSFDFDGFISLREVITSIYQHINQWDGTLLEFKLGLDYCEKCLGRGDYTCPTCEAWYDDLSDTTIAEIEAYDAHFAMDKCEYGRVGCEECNGLGFKNDK